MQMKFNWKIIVALVLIVAAGYWAMDTTRQRSYSGENLTFGVGSGPVTVTNPSDAPVTVQLVSPETRSFSVSSTLDLETGTSTRVGSGREAAHVFEFALPSGVSTFTVTRGRNVNFVADTETNLQATVQSVNASEANMILIGAAIVILGSLFYISRSNGHRWIAPLRRKQDAALAARQAAAAAADSHGQGRAVRSYGDNRANVGD
jgi:hypothetical protein